MTFFFLLFDSDCDSDADCQGDLICFERDNADVPGCLGNPSFKRDYCIQQVPNYLTVRGNNGSPAENFPLGQCEGDCDSDSECAEGLECFQRSGLEPVPGCDGLVRCDEPQWCCLCFA